MSLLGINLTVLIGATIPRPAPLQIMEALESVEVTHNDSERSGFQIVFQIGRSGPADIIDYALLREELLQPCSRVILAVTFNGMPRVLMDGIITNHQLQLGDGLDKATLTITGEDISMMMDLEEISHEHTGENELQIVNKIVQKYKTYNLIAYIKEPPTLDTPNPQERIPVQQSTDLQYLKEMAARFSYVFYIIPGPAALTNTAYWGPKHLEGLRQPPLSVNLGPDTNVDSISYQNDALSPTIVSGTVQDRNSNENVRVETSESSRASLTANPALVSQACVRKKIYRADSDLTAAQAGARAQAITDDSTESVTVQGELDATRYNEILQARGLVELRGAGFSYNGKYYVKSVTHRITVGEYKQHFVLKRDGVGSTIK